MRFIGWHAWFPARILAAELGAVITTHVGYPSIMGKLYAEVSHVKIITVIVIIS